jgi:hypothetical protein
MATKPQSYANHVRYVPAYHFVTFGILALNLLYRIVRLVRHLEHPLAMDLLLAIAFLLMFFYARQFAMTVQDRVIRLEMRIRLARVLPSDLAGRIGDLTLDQLIALRFASDGELPELTGKVLAEGITDRKAIKQMIKDWQPDTLRA